MKRTTTLFLIAIMALVVCYLGYTPPVSADRLNLSDIPLFLGFETEPNIFFLLDDSGSMDWEVMTQDTGNWGLFASKQPDGSNDGSGSVTHRDRDDDGKADCAFKKDDRRRREGYRYGVEFSANLEKDDESDCNTADEQAWRFRTNAFNPLYFNPHQIYKPWQGLNKRGVPFPNMDPTNALENPYDPDNSETINLLVHNTDWQDEATREISDRDKDGLPDGFFFYTWKDLNGNNLFDDGEETEHQLNDLDQAFLDSLIPTFGQAVPVTTTAVQQNFANWFSYYRKREYVAKAAYSEVIAKAVGVRMGLATLHNNNKVNTPLRSMNQEPESGNKRALLDALYSIHSSGGTPLLTSLVQTGKYMECDENDLFSSCPALSAEEGGACQQNFAIIMTDGFYNGSWPSLGNTDKDSSDSEWDGGAYADNYPNTLADVAMHFYERDLHDKLEDHVPVIPGVDDAKHQHIVTYGVAFGVDGSLTDNPSNNVDPFPWPDPTQSDTAKIDDLRHAAYNGRGKYLNASRPEELVDALNEALNSIADRTASAASVALNSGSHHAGTHIFQARFNSGEWSGQLLAFPIDEDGDVQPAAWEAGDILNALDWNRDRTILTYKSADAKGIPFRWDKLDNTMQDLLHLNAEDEPDNRGRDRLEYLRGRRDKEDQLFRDRKHVFGDVIHSDPYFVGVPPFPNRIGEGYADFRATYSNRMPMVYLGGNDGMLHGFDVNTGVEKLAYIPGAVFQNLSYLTEFGYHHRYYVDGSPTIGDVYGNFGQSRCSPESSCWRSVLISGLRKGGQGVFALDVTDPSTFVERNAATLVLWEFTDADDPHLGYTFSQPSIVKMANGRWAAVIGNGYNNTEARPTRGCDSGSPGKRRVELCHVPPGNPANRHTITVDQNAVDTHLDHGDTLCACGPHVSDTGYASLFILFIDKGNEEEWTHGVNYFRIDAPVGELDTPNGLASPAPIDVNGDYVIDYIYAGDLRGNLWKFDVSSTETTSWLTPPALLFTARTSGETPQPQSITSRLEVGRHPERGVLVHFGTGKFLEPSDQTTNGVQTVYGIWDPRAVSPEEPESLAGCPVPISPTMLLEQKIEIENAEIRIVSDQIDDADDILQWGVGSGAYCGWRLNLPTLGERQVSRMLLRNKRLIFTTLIPDTEECSFGGGGWLMEIEAIDGSRLEESPFDLNGDNKFDEEAISGLRSTEGILSSPAVLFARDVEYKYSSGAKGGIFKTNENPGEGARGRQAWQQLK